MMDDFEKAEWIVETRRQFEALADEMKMAMDDLVVLQDRVMLACVTAIDPNPIEPAFIPPTIAIAAERASVKEG
jgi:hypothetical protein